MSGFEIVLVIAILLSLRTPYVYKSPLVLAALVVGSVLWFVGTKVNLAYNFVPEDTQNLWIVGLIIVILSLPFIFKILLTMVIFILEFLYYLMYPIALIVIIISGFYIYRHFFDL